MSDEKELLNLTEELIDFNKSALISYQRVRETGIQGDFYKEVKPFADNVKTTAEKWLPLAMNWVMIHKPKHVHPIQLHNLVENIQMVSVKAYYPDTSLKRFKSHIQSVSFVLESLLEELRKNN